MLTKNEVKELGFTVSNKAWATAKEHLDSSNNIPGAPVEETRGRKPIANVVIELVQKFMESSEMSRPASNRTYKGTPVRYRNTSCKEAYYLWRKKFASDVKLSDSSFRNIVHSIKHLKKPCRQTDKCEFCIAGRRVQSIYEKCQDPVRKAELKKKLE